ncbi:UDP-N-acetylmuramate dehydrogenase [Sulfobacillus sp. DSM 109850]|uniref:UDP-N-acetylenolpyruvoylglucosamine reductase n=2 Tax=Sulfobacillus harzensis TaxID=2729629 RepID=A0A7Y0L3B2_9FIRM|nr:UDP-N-acetylmuramate dehydrogenase [Sulfobacillus harzensis]
MDVARVAEALRSMGVGTVREQEPLSRHTSFRIGGPASVFVDPDHLDGVVKVLDWVRDQGLPYFIIGQGTNILVSDRGVEAVVISTVRGLRDFRVEPPVITAGSGVLLTKLCRLAEKAGLTGLEFAISIPGTLGGALVMNAGAHGGEMVEVVESVLVWDAVKGVHRIDAAEAQFQYRQSRFMKNPWIALEAVLRLKPGDPAETREKMRHNMEYRKKSQPVGEPNAGSIFKNPLPHYAGRLIEQIGAKGWREGDAMVSDLHANFIVNAGSATARDVLELMRRIRRTVYRETGIVLKPEVRWIGPGEGGAEATWENLWYAEGGGLTEP